jgi:type IV pilus assembly protein PilB
MAEAHGVEVPKFYRGVGCKKCRNTGYSGRIAIHELFVPDDEVLEMISDRINTKKLRAKAVEKGMLPLVHDGIEKVKAGIVSIEEILRTAAIDNPVT